MIDQKTVLVTDTSHSLYGQRLKGGILYHDYYHTGHGPDLFVLKTKEGGSVKILSTSVDVEDFENQCLAEVIGKLGVNIGDTVIIEETGGGLFAESFDRSGEHMVSDIDLNGCVHFKGTSSYVCRPVFKVVKKATSDQVEVSV